MELRRVFGTRDTQLCRRRCETASSCNLIRHSVQKRDNGKFGGRILEVHRALDILRGEGPLFQY
jgi:hypothetical protein